MTRRDFLMKVGAALVAAPIVIRQTGNIVFANGSIVMFDEDHAMDALRYAGTIDNINVATYTFWRNVKPTGDQAVLLVDYMRKLHDGVKHEQLEYDGAGCVREILSPNPLRLDTRSRQSREATRSFTDGPLPRRRDRWGRIW